MTDNPPDGTEPPSEPEVDPEQIGADLFRRLDMLDDRLQRSQEKMLSLLQEKLNHQRGTDPESGTTPGSEGGQPAAEPPAPASPAVLWAPPPPVPPNGGPVTGGAASGFPGPPPEAPGVADPESMDAWFGGASPTSLPPASPSKPGAGSGFAEYPEAPGGGEVPAWPEPAEDQVATIVPAHRPAWQSNVITVAITALVVVVGLFLVGLF